MNMMAGVRFPESFHHHKFKMVKWITQSPVAKWIIQPPVCSVLKVIFALVSKYGQSMKITAVLCLMPR
jgi:hypothetical protein